MKKQMMLGLVIMIFFMSGSNASAWRIPGFGSRPHVGAHVNTNGDVGVDVPTPEATINTHGVSTTVTPNSIYTNVTDSNGVSVGADTNGQVYGNVNRRVPGGTASGRVDANGVNVDTLIDAEGR